MKRESASTYALLGMLSLRPMTGYEIKQSIQESVAHFWNESYGQLYPALKRLAATGLATRRKESAARRPGRQVYSITAKGKSALREWLARPSQPQPPRNELLLKLFFSAGEGKAHAVTELERLQRRCAQELVHFRALERDLTREHAKDASLPYWLCTLEYGRTITEARATWAIKALRSLPRVKGRGK